MQPAFSARKWRSWKTRSSSLDVLRFTFPTCVVPMAPQVGSVTRDAHVVPHARGNVSVASGAYVLLVGLVGLHSSHLDWPIQAVPQTHPKNAHAVIAAMITRAEATMAMSLGRFTRLRIGLNPISSVLSR